LPQPSNASQSHLRVEAGPKARHTKAAAGGRSPHERGAGAVLSESAGRR
jgi:hypothetical protein